MIDHVFSGGGRRDHAAEGLPAQFLHPTGGEGARSWKVSKTEDRF